ncbi:MAG: lipopolysaccharide biosynthesis protein [Phycisphaerales bacterium]
MTGALRQRTWQAVYSKTTETVLSQGFGFVLQMILARMLLPEQFGLIGMLVIFIAIAEVFVNSGFAQALIQKQDANYDDECSVFCFNVVVSVMAYSLLYLAAGWIGAFYQQPGLEPLIRVLALCLIINATGQIQWALLEKSLNFAVLMRVGVISNVFAGIVALLMASLGYGVWSLVGLRISRAVGRVVLAWFYHPWRPRFVVRLQSLKTLFSYGVKLLGAGLLDQFFVHIHTTAIGRLFTPSDLGLYSRAKSIEELPIMSLTSAASSVLFPAFSTLQNDVARLRGATVRVLTVLCAVLSPCLIGLAVVARPLVSLLLTEKWTPCVPYVQLLCVAGILWPMTIVNLEILKACGRSDLFLRVEVIKKALVLIALLATYRCSIMAIVIGQVISSLVGGILNGYYGARVIRYHLIFQLKDMSPYVGMSVLMGASVYLLTEWLESLPGWGLLLVVIPVGVLLYAIPFFSLGLPARVEVVHMLRDLQNRRTLAHSALLRQRIEEQ